MKVKEMVGFGNGSIRITLESEHPAELAMIRLMDDCEAKCEAKTSDIPPEANHLPGTPPVDPELHINVTVKNNGNYIVNSLDNSGLPPEVQATQTPEEKGNRNLGKYPNGQLGAEAEFLPSFMVERLLEGEVGETPYASRLRYSTSSRID